MKNQFSVKPVFCEESQWFKMGVFCDDEVIGYVLWIENSSTPFRICKVNRVEMGRPIAENRETAESMCEQIQEMIDNGDIE